MSGKHENYQIGNSFFAERKKFRSKHSLVLEIIRLIESLFQADENTSFIQNNQEVYIQRDRFNATAIPVLLLTVRHDAKDRPRDQMLYFGIDHADTNEIRTSCRSSHPFAIEVSRRQQH